MIYDMVNKRETNTTQNSSDDWHPRYSYDGNFIGFVSERDDLRDVEFDQLKDVKFPPVIA